MKTLQQAKWLALLLLALALALAVRNGVCDDRAKDQRPANPIPPRVDLLVFAPHPDDEALGCGGIIRQALAAGRRVKVVLLTNGDGFPEFAGTVVHRAPDSLTAADFLELARFRQIQTQKAFAALGGAADDLIFLGYPDSALEQVFQAQDAAPVKQKFTEKSETYGAAQRDYHSATHGQPAPYTRAAMLGDVSELIQTFRPVQIRVTNEADLHPDHKAAFRIVREGAKAASYPDAIQTYLVHGGREWPWPKGVTPDAPLEAHEVKGERNPVGVPWPPPRRVAISRAENALKLQAIQAHATHLADGATGESAASAKRAYLESFIKAEEVFWPVEQ